MKTIGDSSIMEDYKIIQEEQAHKDEQREQPELPDRALQNQSVVPQGSTVLF